MDRWFVYFAVQKPPRLGLETFDVQVLAPTLAKILIAADIQQDRVDLDRSALFDVGTQEAADDIKAHLHAEFFAFTWSNHLRAQGRFKWGKVGPDNGSGNYVVTAQESGDILAKFARYIIDNRVRLGDEGDWQTQSLRDYARKRPWVFLSDQTDETPPAGPTVALAAYEADHRDEVATFRLPSISVLAGHAQPIAALKGQKTFQHLFIRDGAGVYVVFDVDDVLYVGMAQRFSQRLMNANAHHKLRLILERHREAQVALIHYPAASFSGLANAVSSAEREVAQGHIRELVFGLERSCISFYQPRYNGLGRTPGTLGI